MGSSTLNSKVDWNKTLTDFEKLLLIKTMQEEKLVFAITEFVKINLGEAFIESPQVSLNLLYVFYLFETPFPTYMFQLPRHFQCSAFNIRVKHRF